MKRLMTAAALIALSLTPAMAAGCCGKSGKGMCAKPPASMSMKGGKKGCCCEGMGKSMRM
ncbi:MULTISPECIES: hypothetical protein [Methylobacterium]|uniref:Protein of unassigned function n=2 Tax=Methylobacterium TaxID=407 RepID=A0A089NRZ2_9HYPH|nr:MULTISPECIES: hypothetical protein [Methylobacterium]ACB24527.1 hypothetical protein Mrad2831_2537 [Methylobacterium radiotolerans JCM 2831]AIQ90701.1 protein of unassigned function [Methylobacterium oryzae CBMB20]GEN01308.1 hypothetical protein MRA01_58470 [Methylobacterium radiotolerans]